LWFTGLSGSGKSTLSKLVEEKLLERGVKVELLDGDEVRNKSFERAWLFKRGQGYQYQKDWLCCKTSFKKWSLRNYCCNLALP